MPVESATGTANRRASASPRRVSANAAASLAESPRAQGKQAGQQKLSRHVVGHSRLGTRNPSFGRNLSKITTLAGKDDDSSSVPRDGAMLSPKPKSNVKRNHSSAGIMPKSASHVALRKNLSSGQLVRNASAKQLSKAGRPEIHSRTSSQSHLQKAKRKQSPARATARQQTVHFDVGSEDEAEGMEDVDDGWTEDSVSPITTRDNTRDNTRSNTRRGSVIDPVAAHRDGNDGGMHTDHAPHNEEEVTDNGIQVRKKSETSGDAHMTAQRSSYHDTVHHKPLDPEDITKRLLQKQSHSAAPPLVSDVSITASTEALDPRRIVVHENGTAKGASASDTPLISRFTDGNTVFGSRDGTPVDAPNLTSQSGGQLQSPFHHPPGASRSPTHSHRASLDIKRNQSLPSFVMPHSPYPEGGSTSGSTTPGGGFGHGGRIQQKMWLQRGLSEMESRSQQNLRGMLTPGGRPQRLGAQPDSSERIETELKVVRRYRHPVEESMDRLRRLKDSPLPDHHHHRHHASHHSSPGKKSARSARDGFRTPTAVSIKTHGSPPTPASAAQGGATFSLSAVGDDDGASTIVSQRDWDKLGVDDLEALRELEEATLDIRRQMWELQLVGGEGEE